MLIKSKNKYFIIFCGKNSSGILNKNQKENANLASIKKNIHSVFM